VRWQIERFEQRMIAAVDFGDPPGAVVAPQIDQRDAAVADLNRGRAVDPATTRGSRRGTPGLVVCDPGSRVTTDGL